MEEADKTMHERGMELPEVEISERQDEVSRSVPSMIQRPDCWSVFGRPARRLFRVNCRD